MCLRFGMDFPSFGSKFAAEVNRSLNIKFPFHKIFQPDNYDSKSLINR